MDKRLKRILTGKFESLLPLAPAATSKSGALFFTSANGSLIFKSIKSFEAKKMLRELPMYIAHFQANPESLLTKFCGLYYSSKNRMYFMVMKNIMPRSIELKACYDLKGSTHGRSVPPEKRKGPTSALQDLDLPGPLPLASPGDYDKLQRLVQADAALLETLQTIDYSLLVCIGYPRGGSSDGGAWHSGGAEHYWIGIIDMLIHYDSRVAVGVLLQKVYKDASWQPPTPYAQRFVAMAAKNFTVGSPVRQHQLLHKPGLYSPPAADGWPYAVYPGLYPPPLPLVPYLPAPYQAVA
uniref:PIPK domain-containing protein n=1 Tax=Eutreptiella gymnastica TaxID=73025 RepID=A0A7S4CU14_9EUGL